MCIRCIAIVLFSLGSLQLSSQDTVNHKQLNVFLPFQYNDRVYQEEEIIYRLGGFKVILPTLNYAWEIKGIIQEFGLHLLRVDHRIFFTDPPREMPQALGETREALLGADGYYSFNIILYPDPHLQPVIGIATQPYFHQRWREPVNDYGIYANQTVLGNTLWLIPRLQFNRENQVFFEITIPVALLDTYWIGYKDLSNQQSNRLTFYSLTRPPLWRVQLGVGYHLRQEHKKNR